MNYMIKRIATCSNPRWINETDFYYLDINEAYIQCDRYNGNYCVWNKNCGCHFSVIEIYDYTVPLVYQQPTWISHNIHTNNTPGYFYTTLPNYNLITYTYDNAYRTTMPYYIPSHNYITNSTSPTIT